MQSNIFVSSLVIHSLCVKSVAFESGQKSFKLVAEYLLKTYGINGSVSWAIAARDEKKLELFCDPMHQNLNGKLITAAQTKRQIPMQPPPKEAFEAVKEGQPVIMTLGGQAQIRSLLKLDEFDGVYLYTAKKVDPQIVEHLAKTDIAMREYNSLESQRFEAQLTFALIYIGIALVLLLAAIWFGLGLANGLASPIGQLIVASKRVSSGKLDTRVDIDGSDEDINRLGHTFNQMTEQLSKLLMYPFLFRSILSS